MRIEVAVPISGAMAFYDVSKDAGGICHAQLIRIEGTAFIAPPQVLTLIRGVRRWVGSFERTEIVEEIGRYIEQQLPNDRHGGRSTSSDPASGY